MSRLFLILTICTHNATQFESGLFKKIHGYKAPESVAALHGEKAKEPTLQRCSLICLSVNSCKSFDLEISTGICTFYNWKWLSSDSTYAPLEQAAFIDHYEIWNG